MPLSDVETAMLREGAADLGVSLGAAALVDLGRYLDELDHWRPRVNLVSAWSRDELIERHLLDSLAAVPLIEPAAAASLVDLGSGAGLPGIPLAIARPDLGVTLVEPRRKRASFLRTVARLLERPRLQVIEARVEEIPHTDAGRVFDIATTRAAFAAGVFPEVARNLLRSGGLAIAYTTARAWPADPSDGAQFDPPRRYPYRIRGEAGKLMLMVWRRR